MNYKTIRAYQFKADQAVAALEAAGSVWTVGQGKPHWAMPIVPTVDVEAIKKEARKEFLAEIMAIDAPKVAQKDDFEIGPTTFPDRHLYVGRTAKLLRVPSWHGCSPALIGSFFNVDEIKYTTKTHYSGYTVAGTLMGQKVWFPISCVKF